VIEFMVSAATQAFFVAYTVAHHYHVPLLLRIAQQIVAFFANTFVGPILAIGTTLFYYDQRVRKEGYDLEWMMAAAGLGGTTSREASPESVNAAMERDALEAPGLQAAPDALGPGDGI